jgi:hypothetical protein
MSLRFARTGVYEATGAAPAHDYEGQPYPAVEDVSKPALGIGGFQLLPTVVVVSDLGLKTPLRVAIGLIAPHGYPEREFQPAYDFQDPVVGPPPQRYDIMRQEATVVQPSLGLAYRVMPELDLGLRATWGIGGLKATSATWGVRNYDEYISKDGIFDVDVSDSFVPGFGLGVLFRPHPSIELGASYSSQLTVEGRGTGTAALGSELGVGGEQDFIAPIEDDFALCDRGGSVDALKACITVKLPQTAAVGARWILRDADGGERADVELDFKWENWGAVSDYSVVVDGQSSLTGLDLNPQFIRHGLKDSLSFRAGGSYTLPVGGHKLTLRAGVAHDTEAAPLSWTRLDIDGNARTTIAAGVALHLRRVRIDLGGGASLEGDRTVATCNPDTATPGCDGTGTETPVLDRDRPDPIQPLAGDRNQIQSPFNNGTYSSGYTLLTLGVTTWF